MGCLPKAIIKRTVLIPYWQWEKTIRRDRLFDGFCSVVWMTNSLLRSDPGFKGYHRFSELLASSKVIWHLSGYRTVGSSNLHNFKEKMGLAHRYGQVINSNKGKLN